MVLKIKFETILKKKYEILKLLHDLYDKIERLI